MRPPRVEARPLGVDRAPGHQQFGNTNLAEIVVTPRDLAARNTLRAKMIEPFRNEFPNLRGRVKLLPNGPPVPYPVQFRVEVPDAATVRRIADEVRDVMRANSNTRGVNDNWNESVKRLALSLDQDRARALGVSTQMLARAAQTILSGSTIGQFREGDQLINIVLRQPLDERAVMSRLAEVNIATGSGRAVPLSQLVKFQFGWSPGSIPLSRSVLGPGGVCHHGRPDRRDRVESAVPARALRGLVPRRGSSTAGRRPDPGRTRPAGVGPTADG